MRYTAILFAALFLTACDYGTPDQFASKNHVEKYTYSSNEPPSLTLLTMINNKSGLGGHSSLLITGSQTVMYDPAGRWESSTVPEQHDFLYGFTPEALKRYKSFHARKTHHVVLQKVYVSPEIAEQAIVASKAQGRAKDATCAINTIAILHKLSGFEGLKRTFFPATLKDRFGELDGVVTETYYENDEGQH